MRILAMYPTVSSRSPQIIAIMYPHVLCLIPRKTCEMRKSANIPAKIPFPTTVGRYMKLDKVKSQVSRVQRYGCFKSVEFPTHSC